MGWNKITVKQYQEVKGIDPNLPTLDSDILKLAILFKKPTEFFEGLTFAKLQTCRFWLSKVESAKLPTKVKPVLWLNGTRYKLISNPADFNTSAYLALQLYRQDSIKNLANILSWIYKPTLIKHTPDKHLEDFEQAKISDIYGAFFLFLKQYRKWKVATNASDLQIMKTTMDHLAEAEQWAKSQSFTDGIIPSNA